MKRPRPVTVLGWLLLFQALGLLLISGVNFSQVGFVWEITRQDFNSNLPIGLRGWAFAALAFLALITGVRLFRLRESAWLHAMFLQGLNLSMAIGVYLQEKPFYVYLIMMNCIFMVLYLNYSEVLITFRSEEKNIEWGGINER